MMDNLDVAILNRVNELAERHGFSPTDFIAGVHRNDKGNSVLVYEQSPDASPDSVARFDKMLESAGITSGHALTGSVEAIYTALTDALARAPRPRGR